MIRDKIDETTSRALEAVFGQLNTLPAGQAQRDFVEILACVSVALIRGRDGDGYARGFLQAALRDLDKPAQHFAPPRKH